MKLHRFDTIDKFWDKTQAYLLQHDAENNVLLGVIHTLLHNPERYPDPPYLANPTSNHIYREIGYVPVCDWHEYSFIS